VTRIANERLETSRTGEIYHSGSSEVLVQSDLSIPGNLSDRLLKSGITAITQLLLHIRFEQTFGDADPSATAQRLRLRSQVGLVLALTCDSKPEFRVKLNGGVDLYHGQGHRLCLISCICKQELKDLRSHSPPLHCWRYVERSQVYAPLFNLLLNPAHVASVGSNDPDLLELEELIKVFVLAHFISAEQALDDPTHRLDLHGARRRYLTRALLEVECAPVIRPVQLPDSVRGIQAALLRPVALRSSECLIVAGLANAGMTTPRPPFFSWAQVVAAW
jgi:hypothetical protein